MFQLIKKRLSGLSDKREAFDLTNLFANFYQTGNLISPGLAIAAAATLTNTAIVAMVGGRLVSAASGTISLDPQANHLPQVPISSAQVWIVTLDQAGAFNTYAGIPAVAGTLGNIYAGVTLPFISETVPAGYTNVGIQQAVVGIILMNNASVGAFIPGTTLTNVGSLGFLFIPITNSFYPIQQI